jgi:hypothetical protein
VIAREVSEAQPVEERAQVVVARLLVAVEVLFLT